MAAVVPAPESADVKASLATASSLVDGVLLQIGKVFRDAGRGDAKAFVNAKGSIQSGVPNAYNKFQEALDRVEIPMLKAKAALEYDLAKLRQKRAQREKSAGQGRLQSDIAIAGKKSENSMSDTAAKTEDEFANADNSTSTVDNILTAKQDDEATSPPDANHVGEDGLADTNTLAGDSTKHPEGQSSLATTADNNLNDQQEDLTNVADIDFDSMFADVAGEGGDGDDFNFDFVTSIDETGMREQSDMNSGGGPPITDDDINNLLPGLENYTAGDNATTEEHDIFTGLNFPLGSVGQPAQNGGTASPEKNANGKNETQATSSGATAATETQSTVAAEINMDDSMPMDSTFEDMFYDSGGLDMTGMGDAGDDLQMEDVGDFDDSWLESI